MLSFLTRLLRPARPKALTEIELVRAALVRHRMRVEDMDAAWRFARSSGACCPSCMFGSAYAEATRKVERTEAWLRVLERKQRS